MTKTSVEIGMLCCNTRLVVFLVPNKIPRNTDPLVRYAERIAVV